MIQTIVFLTPHYLNFASEKALQTLGRDCRTVLDRLSRRRPAAYA